MKEIKGMLYQLQRFQILALFTNSQAERNVSPSYAFAWSEGVYPLLNEGADWHHAYADNFQIGKQQVEELLELLSNRWDQKNLISFYELEDHYQVRGAPGPGPVWSRSSLWQVCRYFYLNNLFDAEFWNALLENGRCPSEAHSIARPFLVGDVYFE